jgi:glutathione S-transferase
MTMKLYHSPGACSLAPHIALAETGIAFEAVRIDFAKAEQRSPEYLAINPKGRVPALSDNGFVVTENPAILRYIARHVPSADLWPTDPRDEARCAEWLAWSSSTVHPAYAHIARAERYATSEEAKAEVQAKGRETCRDLWGQIETRLAQGPWALGEIYSVVDPYLFVFWNWGRGARLGYDMAADFPNFTAHARRLAARPAVSRVLAEEGIAAP